MTVPVVHAALPAGELDPRLATALRQLHAVGCQLHLSCPWTLPQRRLDALADELAVPVRVLRHDVGGAAAATDQFLWWRCRQPAQPGRLVLRLHAFGDAAELAPAWQGFSDPAQVRTCLRAFSEPEVGLVTLVTHLLYEPPTDELLDGYCGFLGIPPYLQAASFAGGGMFWQREDVQRVMLSPERIAEARRWLRRAPAKLDRLWNSLFSYMTLTLGYSIAALGPVDSQLSDHVSLIRPGPPVNR